MTVSIVTAAESGNLLSLQSVKDYLKITDDSQDASLSALITRASSDFVRHLGRPLALQVYRERQKIHGRAPGINLSRGPLAAIQSIKVDGKGWLVPLDECDVDREHARVLSTAFLKPTRPGDPWSYTVEVVYTAGYLLPQAEAPKDGGALLPVTAQELPAGIAGGCLTTIQMLLSAEGRDPLLRSESVQGVGNTSWQALDASVGAISSDALAALDGLSLAADWLA
ncbi:phage head-tail connector protein [Acetobacter senegalensis]|uniref:phage head-tail connector protein n=1 Tax=Acetobacter senegalensis TaxID=446692 RepID=UPI00128D97B8|nr:phage head-tail connector protein [Acetobacter senegalensis]MPQ75242.1 hypothetical protein [Acetobacter senegalensis]